MFYMQRKAKPAIQDMGGKKKGEKRMTCFSIRAGKSSEQAHYQAITHICLISSGIKMSR